MSEYRSEAEAVAAYRKENPRGRAMRIDPLLRNSRVRQRWCIVCGEHGPTWCGDWPETKRARAWSAEHRAKHISA